MTWDEWTGHGKIKKLWFCGANSAIRRIFSTVLEDSQIMCCDMVQWAYLKSILLL